MPQIGPPLLHLFSNITELLRQKTLAIAKTRQDETKIDAGDINNKDDSKEKKDTKSSDTKEARLVANAKEKELEGAVIPWKKILPIVLLSMPFAFLGGMIQLDGPIYKLLAGITLVVAAFLIIKPVKENQIPLKNISMLARSTIGSGIGFISGLIGIGGGIFLSPFLNILRWQTAKVISVTASVFILFNSVAGIAGQLTNPISINIQQILTLGLAVAIGGQIGNYLNIKLLSPRVIKLLTAILVCVVGVRFILNNT